MRYRPEIDGLRACAVLPVVFFHAGFDVVSGGYVGVDVFFVISGYLITSIIWSEIRAGEFSIWTFYERRARRILPALFVVIAATVAAAWVILAPKDAEPFGQSVIAAIAFYSNILFWREDGYFDVASELKPLLHTWSLSVEEQFYILFPLALLLLRRAPLRFLVAAIGFVLLVSLALGHWGATEHPSAAFYLLPTRAWELMIGALVALYLAGRAPVPITAARHGLSLLGLVMLAGAVLVFDETIPVPGVPMLVPTLGTAFIILFATEGTVGARLLSLRPVVAAGLISYSVYLWHNPLFAFARYQTGAEPAPGIMLGLSALSLLLGWLSWRFIEAPFRDRARFGRRQIFSFALAGGTCLAAVGGFLVVTEGTKLRPVTDSYRTFMASLRDGPARSKAEVIGDADNVVGVLLGDSHANMLIPVLREQLAQDGQGLLRMTKSGCPPVRGLLRHDLPPPRRCHDTFEALYDRLLKDPKLEVVVVAARYSLYLESNDFDNGEGGTGEHAKRVLFDGLEIGQEVRPDADRRDRIAAQFETDLQALLDAGKRLILVYPVPEIGWDVSLEAWQRRYDAPQIDIDISQARYLDRSRSAYEMLDGLGEGGNIRRLHPAEALCDTFVPERCVAVMDSKGFYNDSNHLSSHGVALLAAPLSRLVSEAAR